MSVLTLNRDTLPNPKFRPQANATLRPVSAGTSHLATIKRFARFVLMVAGFAFAIAAVMSLKYAAFLVHFAH
jgi:hypothetical protein